MPLSEPAPRLPLHRRAIEINGFQREDGLFDIEAHLTDQKAEAFEHGDRGRIAPHASVHDMWVRLTIDEEMRITACEAATDFSPFTICPGAAAAMSRVVGLTIKAGFLKEVAARLGGAEGCTHLRELLQQIGTTAYQTLWPIHAKRGTDSSARLLNSCFALASDGPVVRERWPQLYTGPRQDAPAQLTVAGSREG